MLAPNSSVCWSLASSRSFLSKPRSPRLFIFWRYWLLLRGCFRLICPPRLCALLKLSWHMLHDRLFLTDLSLSALPLPSFIFVSIFSFIFWFGVCWTAVDASVRIYCPVISSSSCKLNSEFSVSVSSMFLHFLAALISLFFINFKCWLLGSS